MQIEDRLQLEAEELIRNDACSLYDLCGHNLVLNSYANGRVIYNFGKPFLSRHSFLIYA